MYDLSGTEVVELWLGRHKDPAERLALLNWLPALAADPEGVAMARRQRPGVPVFTAEVPDVACWVTYSVIEQYRTVHILRIDEPPEAPVEDRRRRGR
ncbi:MAG: hypothetical protein ACRDZN_16075 [Acidimicrobiales bacterium]